MSKILLQILKNSLIPASCMIVSKLIGLYLAVTIFGLNIFLENEVQNIFTVQLYIDNRIGTLLANSISNLFMLLFMLSITGYLLIKYSLYLQTVRDPRTIVKLSKFNMLKWVTDKDTGFIRIFTWSLFLLTTCAIIITNTLTGDTYLAVGLAAFIASVLVIWGVIRSFESEIARVYPKENPYL